MKVYFVYEDRRNTTKYIDPERYAITEIDKGYYIGYKITGAKLPGKHIILKHSLNQNEDTYAVTVQDRTSLTQQIKALGKLAYAIKKLKNKGHTIIVEGTLINRMKSLLSITIKQYEET